MGCAAVLGVGLSLPRGTGMNRAAPGVKLDGSTSNKGVNGFDSGRWVRGSVQVQAEDHLKRRRKPISANSTSQRDVALAA